MPASGQLAEKIQHFARNGLAHRLVINRPERVADSAARSKVIDRQVTGRRRASRSFLVFFRNQLAIPLTINRGRPRDRPLPSMSNSYRRYAATGKTRPPTPVTEALVKLAFGRRKQKTRTMVPPPRYRYQRRCQRRSREGQEVAIRCLLSAASPTIKGPSHRAIITQGVS